MINKTDKNQNAEIYTEVWLKNWVKDNKKTIIDLFCKDRAPEEKNSATFMSDSPDVGKTEIVSRLNSSRRNNFMNIEQDKIKTIIDLFFKDKVPEKENTAIFMSGSPGAGKTEIATRLNSFRNNIFVNIEQDKIKTILPGYIGSNAPHYQKPASKGLSYVIEYVLKNKLSFILDTTFSSYENARRHIENCIKRKYNIKIFFIYQEPLNAWNFVRAREKMEGRVVPLESFARQFVEARETVNRIKKEYGKAVLVSLVFKNLVGNKLLSGGYHINIDNIDSYIKKEYNKVYKSEEEIYAEYF